MQTDNCDSVAAAAAAVKSTLRHTHTWDDVTSWQVFAAGVAMTTARCW